MQPGLQIGEVAARARVSVDTVRYYERLKLLPRARRSEGGFRIFPSEAVERVQFIKRAQDIGLSLEEIRGLLAGGGQSECKEMRDILRAKLADIDQRIITLRQFRRTLAEHLNACEEELKRHGSDARCPVITEITHSTKKTRQRNEKSKNT
jgi:DNA-binding transcriptional MerR regulator